MARPRKPTPDAPGDTPQSPETARVLTADERASPLFRSLRDIDTIEDDELRLAAALDRLDAISKMALGRVRTVGKDQREIIDPDCNAAVKVEEVAHRLLSIEPRKPRPKDGVLDVFNRPTLVKAQ
jgi:hypothetical protein